MSYFLNLTREQDYDDMVYSYACVEQDTPEVPGHCDVPCTTSDTATALCAAIADNQED